MKFTKACGIVGALALCMAGSVLGFERGQLRETRQMALDLAISAKRVSARAEAQTDAFRRSERRMLGALKRFSQSADQFDEALDTYWTNPGETQSMLSLLNEDAAVVNHSIRRAQPMGSVIRDWDNCNSLLERINSRFTERDARVISSTADERWYVIDGNRYPRRGNRYQRNGRWIEIQSSTSVAANAGSADFIVIEGNRYPRRGNRYQRDGRWIEIESNTSVAANADPADFVIIDGVRYKRDGERYFRDGRWQPISTKRAVVNAVVNGLLNNVDR